MNPADAAEPLDAPPGRLRISEIYTSIQGESTHAGRPCTFVRLVGCPLRCTWCDTSYAFTGGRFMTMDAILAEVERQGQRLVELTGGEPLAQAHTPELISALCAAGREVLIETSGTFAVAHLDPRARVIADLKCPGSGESRRVNWPILAGLRAMDELKIVVADRADFDWALAALAGQLKGLAATVLWSAVAESLPPAELAGWMLRCGAPGRLQIQLHRTLWPDVARGV